jgi:hypothetical protein
MQLSSLFFTLSVFKYDIIAVVEIVVVIAFEQTVG